MRIFGTIRDSKKREPVKQATIKLSIEGWSPDGDDFRFIELKVKYNKEDFVWDDLLVFMVIYQKGY